MGLYGLCVAFTAVQHVIRYTCLQVLQPPPKLLPGNLGKVSCMGGGDFMMGLEKFILGYGPWFGAVWLYPETLGGFLQKSMTCWGCCHGVSSASLLHGTFIRHQGAHAKPFPASMPPSHVEIKPEECT